MGQNVLDIQYINKYYIFLLLCTVRPRSLGPFYAVTYYIKWVNTSWTYSIMFKPEAHNCVSITIFNGYQRSPTPFRDLILLLCTGCLPVEEYGDVPRSHHLYPKHR